MTRVHDRFESPLERDTWRTDSWPRKARKGTYVHSSPPRVVPKKRNPGDIHFGGGDCYDPYEGSFYTSRGREAITQNNFARLFDFMDKIEDKLQPKKISFGSVDSASSQERKKKQEDCCFSNLTEFFSKNHKDYSLNLFLIDDSNAYMYSNT